MEWGGRVVGWRRGRMLRLGKAVPRCELTFEAMETAKGSMEDE